MAAGIEESLDNEQQMVEAGNLQGAYIEQVGRAGKLYVLDAAYLENDRAYHQVAAYLDARKELTLEVHVVTDNAYLGVNKRDTGSEFNTADPDIHLVVKTGEAYYGTDGYGAGTEALDQEVLINMITQTGEGTENATLFQYGAPIQSWPTYTADSVQLGRVTDLSNYLSTTGPDTLFLAERSKQTGEKLF